MKRYNIDLFLLKQFSRDIERQFIIVVYQYLFPASYNTVALCRSEVFDLNETPLLDTRASASQGVQLLMNGTVWQIKILRDLASQACDVAFTDISPYTVGCNAFPQAVLIVR